MPEKRNLRQVAQGEVKEKTLADKACEAFLSEDTRQVKDYILWDVVIPGIKNAVADAIIGGIEMALFGTTKGSRTRRGRSDTHVSYSSYYDSDSSYSSSNRVGRSDRSSRYDFSDIMLKTRGDAESVLTSMEELVNKYGEATVADLCSLSGISPKHTDNKWGWTDCRDFHYRRSGGGYVLDFNPPVYLD